MACSAGRGSLAEDHRALPGLPELLLEEDAIEEGAYRRRHGSDSKFRLGGLVLLYDLRDLLRIRATERHGVGGLLPAQGLFDALLGPFVVERKAELLRDLSG